ncbi:MAG: hypothetical protein UT30_C0007G0005 [Candidatus Uhrbacteria bacterium GW2011_GWF2_39_13]|uniref:Uncharacterized protein n=1 Tax=Candidatus Uhrbacteria bacterium GW2011_GWF2_39_13 TaxID=1618995 RepID=A0A0G0MK80_9BACT|nr:MAG: hypothetical protein UT30_C0007G0005 [Candidatus Uhrbacteria bacterium GW2011_GWF2_39_13]HAU65725.1 hypothetical protein [Candidatus Uhrbacteria bacterium]
MLRRFELTIFCILFLVFFVLNNSIWHCAILGSVLFICYAVVFGWELGGVLVFSEKAILRWWIGFWTLLSCILIVLTFAYYVWQVTPTLISIVILLTVPIMLWITKRFQTKTVFNHLHDLWHEKHHRIPSIVWLVSSLYLFLFVLFFITLGNASITEAVRSVWERLPTNIFIIYLLMTALILALLWRGKERALSLTFVCGLLFATVSIVAIVFPIGFGFDSFIHKATEVHLANFGTITPKPFYYIGQYVLVLFLHHGFDLSIDLTDTFLVPVLTALLLPMAWYFACVHILRTRSESMLCLSGLFLLPLSQFIVTTPQALANLWILLGILASVPYLFEKEHPRLGVLGLTTFATFLIHPIAGIPAGLYFMLLMTDPSRTNPRTPKTNKIIRVCLIAFSCIVLPLSFVANALISGQTLGINWSALNPLSWLKGLNLTIFFENRFDPVLDLIYLYGFNAFLLFFVIAGFAWLEYRTDLSRRFRILLIMVVALGVNYFIMSRLLEFTFLINYERSNYADRLLPLILFFLAPLVILGLGHVFVNIKQQPFVLRTGVLFLLVVMMGSHFYLSYPRRDAYETNRGFNVSQADIDAVHLVETLAQDKPYLVLANQSVSAGAIQEIGFRYYGDLFFYPIPTGEKLYQYFLAMNDHPTRETAQQALALVPMHGDVNTLFFLVNSYWWDAPRIIETAKTTASDWRSLGDGQIYLFRYDFEK